ncbi:MAG: radical SAM protein [candidate division WOR-3 bacterium]
MNVKINYKRIAFKEIIKDVIAVRHIYSNKLFFLKDIAKEIWEFLDCRDREKEIACNEIVEKLLSKFPYPEKIRDKIQMDVRKFLLSLFKEGVILIDNKEEKKDFDFLRRENLFSNVSLLYKIYKENNYCLHVLLELNRKCNFKCKHCYLPFYSQRSYFDIQKLERLIYDLNEVKVFSVTFSGGEVFLENNICEILTLFRENNFLCSIITNGSCINKEHLTCLKDLGIAHIFITLYGTSEKSYERFTGVKAFSRVLNNIEKLLEVNIFPVLQFILNSTNVNEIEDFIRLAEEYKLHYEIDFRIFPKLNYDRSPLNIRLKPEEIYRLIKDKKLGFPSPMKCEPATLSAKIDFEGNVFPCNSLPFNLGNIFRKSFTAIWRSKKAECIRKKSMIPEICKSCDLLDKCINCPATALLENKRIDKPSDFLCKITKMYYGK